MKWSEHTKKYFHKQLFTLVNVLWAVFRNNDKGLYFRILKFNYLLIHASQFKSNPKYQKNKIETDKPPIKDLI